MRLEWMEDRRLVKRAAAGDGEAANRLVSQHYTDVVRFLLHLTGHINEAEELAQETFVKAWQRLATFEGRASLRTWLHRIAYREFALRRNIPDFVEMPEDHMDERQCFVGPLVEAMAMERAIAALPDSLRITFLICQVQEMSVKEAAEILGVPAGTVLSRLFTARERLRRQLAMRDIVSAAEQTEHRFREIEGPQQNAMS
ncbi:MAG TPA: sigma-70 family RNA polymerase sigma factor [Fimbriimonadaceae bacterium]|nr:sigma-70 family RNA polymerase sigma factor [Fimbriimonadaceae bacterium]